MRLYLFIFAEQTAISTPDQLTRLNMLERQQQATRYLTYGNYLLTSNRFGAFCLGVVTGLYQTFSYLW